MTIEQLGNLGEIIAAIATLLTLAYLAVQIRQNRESTRISASHAIMASVNEALQIASSTPQAARVLVLGQSDFMKLDEVEQAQFFVWVFAWFRTLEQAHFHYEKGVLDGAIWEGHAEHLKQVMKGDAAQLWWEYRQHFFNASFRRLVDESILAETVAPHPRGIIEALSGRQAA